MNSDPPEENQTLSEWQTRTHGYDNHMQNVEPSLAGRVNSRDAVSRSSDKERTFNKPLPETASEVNFSSQPHSDQPKKSMRNRDQVQNLKLQLERAKQDIKRIDMEKKEVNKDYDTLYADYCHLKRDLEMEQEQRQVIDQPESQWNRQRHDLKETVHDLQHQLHREKQHVASLKGLADQIHMEKDTSMVIFAPQMMDTSVCQELSSLLGDIRTCIETTNF
ncbi:hypothetical protein BS50DRAFT_368442 [Corynespora cassiicola Philippines]|uniref:Uncharacterized protein n=1 Tax=Corynespora cassiicola Philippines TaxID=1448308 RepID=A0A2T2MZU6_CORCC|nr:hypothetical protein BS50DRAFT_395891 [Corynespora cassiicola Philippines]PSN58764.1 hypothetical protein BS50DRAFT_368442 [Corynespora cassiicola Philippines]